MRWVKTFIFLIAIFSLLFYFTVNFNSNQGVFGKISDDYKKIKLTVQSKLAKDLEELKKYANELKSIKDDKKRIETKISVIKKADEFAKESLQNNNAKDQSKSEGVTLSKEKVREFKGNLIEELTQDMSKYLQKEKNKENAEQLAKTLSQKLQNDDVEIISKELEKEPGSEYFSELLYLHEMLKLLKEGQLEKAEKLKSKIEDKELADTVFWALANDASDDLWLAQIELHISKIKRFIKSGNFIKAKSEINSLRKFVERL